MKDCDKIFGQDEYEVGDKISFNVLKFVAHKDYVPGKKYYDVGVIRLDTPATLDYRINTICLPMVSMTFHLGWDAFKLVLIYYVEC